MAAASSRISRPIFRPENRSLITESGRRVARLLFTTASTDIPLLQKLLKAPLSNIGATLDSEFTSDSAEFPSAALLSSLNSSAPQKANLVIEWKLDKLTEHESKNRESKNRDCYAQLISLCKNIRNLRIAFRVFSSMEARGIKPTSMIFNALIHTSLSSGNLLTALSLFETMVASSEGGYKPDSDTYNAFISAYANLGNKNATESWLTAKKESGFSVDAQTYGCLVQCCIKSKKYDDARKYFDEMILSGLMPNESIFENMIVMYCQQRNPIGVKDILKLVVDYRLKIDRNTVKKVVDLYGGLGLVDELEELVLTLTESGQTSEVLSLVHCSVIRLYAEVDKLNDVEYSVGRMLKGGISFGCEEDVEKVICSYFRAEAYDRLDLFLECIRDSYELTRSIYELLGAGYRRAGLSEKLNAVVNEMKVAGFS